jgi:hypothetical protein
MLRSVSVPTLAGGVSQGLAPLNPPWKVRESVNNVLDVVRGAGKRPGSRHVAVLGAADVNEAVWRTLRFEDDQFYLAQISPASIKVWDRFGAPYPVINSAGSFSYLATRAPNAAEAPEGDWSVVIGAGWAFNGGGSITGVGTGVFGLTPWGEGGSAVVSQISSASLVAGGYTYLYNSDATLVLKPGKAVVSVYVKDPNYEGAAGVLAPTQVGLGLIQPTLGTPPASALFWEYDATSAKWTLKSQLGEGSVFLKQGAVYSGGGWTRLWVTLDLTQYIQLSGNLAGDPFYPTIFQLSGASEVRTVLATGFQVTYGVDVVQPYLLSGRYETLSLGSTTLVLNKAVTVAPGTTLEPTPSAYGDQALFFVAQGAYSTKYTVSAIVDVGGVDTVYFATITTWNGVNGGVGILNSIDPADIAASLRASLTGAIAQNFGPLILLRSAPTQQIKNVIATDSQGGSVPLIRAFDDQAQLLTDLPASAPAGYKLKISGDADFNQDDYYVEFVMEGIGQSGSGASSLGLSTQKYGPGQWIESLPNGIVLDLDEATLPHKIERKIDNALGAVTGTPNAVYFEFSRITWADREVGDDVSNPAPDFVGSRINHMFWVDGRLGFLSQNNVIFSRVDQPFNFWRETVRTFPASDRIQAQAASRDYAELLGTVLYYGRVILISSENHWILNINPSLTAENINFVPFVNFESFPEVPPAYTDSSVYVPYKDGAYTGVRRITPSNADANALITQDVTREIRNYIPGAARQMVSATNLGMLFLLTDVEGVDDHRNIYVYSYAQSGSELIQTAWHKWRMLDRVAHLAVEDSTLYTVQVSDAGVYLESLIFDDVFAAEGTQEWRLDRRVDVGALSVSVSGGKTLFTAPPGFKFDSRNDWKAVYTAASNAPGTFTSSKLKLDSLGAASRGVSGLVAKSTPAFNSALNLKQYFDFKPQALFYRTNYLKGARYSNSGQPSGWLKEAKNSFGEFSPFEDGICPVYPSGPEKGYPNIGNLGTDPYRAGTLLFRDLREVSSDGTVSPLYRAGTYVLTFEGDGTFMVGFDAAPVNQVTNPFGGKALAGETAPGSKRIEFNVANPSTAGVYLAVHTSNPANRVRNMRVFYKADEADLAAQPWLPEFVNDLKNVFKVRVLRPMEFVGSNTSERTVSRVLVTDPFWTDGGWPWEVLCELCNQLDCGIWYNPPGFLDAAAIQSEAAIIRNTLKPELTVVVEGPNEMFNGFPFSVGGGQYATGALVPPTAAWLEGNDATETTPGSGVYQYIGPKPGFSSNITQAAFEGAAVLTNRTHQAFATEFAGQTDRLVYAFGAQAANVFPFTVGISRAPLTQMVVIAPYAAVSPFIDFTHPTYTQEALSAYVGAEVDQAVQFVQNYRDAIDAHNTTTGASLRLGCYEFGFQMVSAKKVSLDDPNGVAPGGATASSPSLTFYPSGGQVGAFFWNEIWTGFLPVSFPITDPQNTVIGDRIKTFMRSAQAGTILTDFIAKVAPLLDGPLAFYADYAQVSPIDGHYALLDYPGQPLSVYPKAQAWAAASAGGSGGGGSGPGGISVGPSDLVDLEGTLIPGPPVPPGTTLTLTWVDADTLSVQGNLLDQLDYLQIGAEFDCYIVLHPPYFRNSREGAILGGSYRAKLVKVAFEDTWRFRVDVQAENGKTYSKQAPSQATATQLIFKTGLQEFPALGDPAKISVALHNPEVTPNWFASVEWLIEPVRR